MNVFSFNMSRHTLVGSLRVIIFRSCDQEVKKNTLGTRERMMVAKAMPLMRRMSEDNGLSRSKSGRSQRDLVTVQITNCHFGP